MFHTGHLELGFSDLVNRKKIKTCRNERKFSGWKRVEIQRDSFPKIVGTFQDCYVVQTLIKPATPSILVQPSTTR